MPVARGGQEHRAVLELADDVLEGLLALQGDVLGVFVAHTAQATVQFPMGDRGTAEPAGL